VRWLLGLGAPLLAAMVWALCVTPNGALTVADPWRLALELVVFGSGVGALGTRGMSAWRWRSPPSSPSTSR
jgi:hypothetical protein